MRRDKHGIPILDPPGRANALPPTCHEAVHCYETVDTRQSGDGVVVTRVCTRCRAVRTDTRRSP